MKFNQPCGPGTNNGIEGQQESVIASGLGTVSEQVFICRNGEWVNNDLPIFFPVGIGLIGIIGIGLIGKKLISQIKGRRNHY